MNPVEDKMMSALRSGEEESAVECARVAEDVARSYNGWYKKMSSREVIRESSMFHETGCYFNDEIISYQDLYNHFINNVYDKDK